MLSRLFSKRTARSFGAPIPRGLVLDADDDLFDPLWDELVEVRAFYAGLVERGAALVFTVEL